MKRIRVIVATGCVIAVAAVVPTHPGLAAPPVQAQSVAATSTLAVIATIPVGDSPRGVAVNDGDDTVYVTNYTSNTVSVINGRTRTEDDTITVGTRPWGVAVDHGDDTVYVANEGSSNVSVINGRTGNVNTIAVGSFPQGVAVDQGDDTVYVINYTSRDVSVINGRSLDDSVTIPVGSNPQGVAVDQGDDTVYVTNSGSNTVSVINGRTRSVDDTITVGNAPLGVAVDGSGTNAGLVYVTNTNDDNVSVIARVSASLGSAFAEAGSTVTLTLAVPQVDYDVADSTVTSVVFGDDTATGLTAVAGDAWILTVPAGSGTVPVTVTFNGGLTASAGSFTYDSAPSPNPPVPASAPVDVTAADGDASAVVTWAAPVSSGSFPISTYQAVVSPGGQTCLVASPALTCTISGLTNGTTYTVTVQALTGAGWGATSSPSSAVTPQRPPQPSITITGTRTEVRGKPGVVVTGTTTGFGMGAILRPWTRFPGQTSYTQGTASILVDVQGGFTWERRTGKTIYISIRSQDNTVVSNRLILRTT